MHSTLVFASYILYGYATWLSTSFSHTLFPLSTQPTFLTSPDQTNSWGRSGRSLTSRILPQGHTECGACSPESPMVRLEVETELPGNSPGSAPRPAGLEKEDSLSYQNRRREQTPKCHPLTSNASRDVSIHTYIQFFLIFVGHSLLNTWHRVDLSTPSRQFCPVLSKGLRVWQPFIYRRKAEPAKHQKRGGTKLCYRQT